MQVISLLCPTRGRAALFKRMCEAIYATTENIAAIELIAYVDEDDKASYELDFAGVPGKTLILPKEPMAVANKLCLDNAQGDIIVLMNDDVVLRTKGWDRLLREKVAQFPDEIYIAYPNDLFKQGKLCTFPIISRKTYEIFVDPFPAQYEGNFIDTHLFDIFQRLKKQGFNRIIYCQDIIFEHMHYRLGKGEFDETYRARRRFGNDVHFIELSDQRSDAALRLQQMIQGLPMLPFQSKSRHIKINSFVTAVFTYIRLFALNRALPWRWRLWLFTHFSARYWAQKIIR